MIWLKTEEKIETTSYSQREDFNSFQGAQQMLLHEKNRAELFKASLA